MGEGSTKERDAKAREFMSDNERFADLFNYYLYHGEAVIRAEELREKDPAQVLTWYGADEREITKQSWRDILKSAVIRTNGSVVYVLLGVENQSMIHYAMPVRNMIYDGMSYASQVRETAKKHRKNKTYGSRAEFLSGFHKGDRLIPVITLVVYWGAGSWDGSRSLHEMMDERYKELLPYVNDYRVHLLIPHEIKEFEKFRTSLGNVLEMIYASEDEEKMERIIMTKPAYKELDNEAVSAIRVFTRTNVSINVKEGKTDMCKAWDDHKMAGVREGIEQGIEQGIRVLIADNLEEGRSEERIVQKLIKGFALEPQKAQEYYDRYACAK